MRKTVSCFVSFLLILSVALLPVCAAFPNDPKIAAVQNAVAAQVGEDTPGAAVGLFENGEIAMLEGFGYADIEARTLVVPDTAFEIGDLSAIFVALAVYRLAEEGALTCDLNRVEVMGRDISVVSTHPLCENESIRSIISAENMAQIAGNTVRFDLKKDKVFLFHKETEQRIEF